VQQVRPDDHIIANGEDENVARLRQDAKARWLTFGLRPNDDISASAIEYTPEGIHFTAHWEGKEWFRFFTTLSGRHNVLNSLANIATCRLAGLEAEEIQKGLGSFRGIKRRMEVRGVERGVTVIDDFAHHPTAIATTLNGARKLYPGRKIWALFEPRSISSGRKEFEKGYIEAFHEADRVVIGPHFHKDRYLNRYGLENMMSIPAIVGSLRSEGIPAEQLDDIDQIAELIGKSSSQGDVVVVMSSGAFGGVHEKILEQLKG